MNNEQLAMRDKRRVQCIFDYAKTQAAIAANFMSQGRKGAVRYFLLIPKLYQIENIDFSGGRK